MSDERHSEAQLLSILAFLALVALLAVASSFFNSREITDIPKWLLSSMYLYLIFVFFRTIFHLLFSFAWVVFRPLAKTTLENYPLVSIILPCFEEEKVVEESIKSVLKMDYPNFEVIVVDDGSTDLTFAKAKEFTKDKRLRVVFQKNAGKAAALNRGLQESLGEYVMCMDADSRLRDNAIQQGMRHMLENPNLAAVAGNVRVGNPNTLVGIFQKLEYVTALNFLKLAQSFLQIVTVVPGPVGLFRKKSVENIGGYDSSTFAEDCDLTLRLLFSGFSVIYEPKMIAVTEVPEQLEQLFSQRYRWSRGILQAIKLNRKWLVKPFSHPRNFFIAWYMLIESAFVPTCNYVFAIATLFVALSSPTLHVIGHYFSQLVILDLVIVIYCLLSEKFSFRLLILAFFNRFTYGLALETHRFFSMIDELLGLPMSWGKLKRKGLL